MSSKQDVFDLGLTFGLLGAFHAPDHTGDPADAHAQDTARLLAGMCGDLVVLTRNHEPRRILTPDQDASATTIGRAHWLQTPASGVVLPRAFLDATGAAAVAMPVTDHTIVSAQVLDADDAVLAFAMVRITRNRSFGRAGEIATLLEVLDGCTLPAPIAQVRFHLNAGRGPCCLPVDRDYLHGIREAMADSEFDLSRFVAYDPETGREGISMVNIVEMDIALCCADRFPFEVHARDNDCVVCCAKHHGMPYYAPEDGRSNLAFVRTDRVLPGRAWSKP